LEFNILTIGEVALLGLATTSSVMLGTVVGLYIPISKKVLASVLAFAAGSLIAALAIELAFEGARDLIRHGANVHVAWLSIVGGFAVGAIVYYVTSLFLDQKGAPGGRRQACAAVEVQLAAALAGRGHGAVDRPGGAALLSRRRNRLPLW
jgi:hypothetical protein